ncbi:MAG: hypothetical protein ABW148_05995 [Sedimenticola sp.]
MSETGNIEELAKIVSGDIFKWFKWRVCALKDENWKCVIDNHKKKTHPSDIVYHYDDPYSGDVIYISTDLKSYKKGSISSTSISNALRSLSISVECANISEDWQNKYLVNDVGFDCVIGMLFIYNHDDEFDKDLFDVIGSIDFDKINISENVKLVLFDPLKIRTLVNIVTDMKGLVADDLLPRTDYTFFYPDLVMSKRHGEEWSQPASIEALTSPWLIIKHRATDEIEEGYVIYYHMSGDTVDEFVYLIDAMSHYQMLLSNKPIRVRFTNPGSNSANNFNKAKLEYLKMWGADEARETQLNRIDARRISKVVSNYCPMEIGMRDHVE